MRLPLNRQRGVSLIEAMVAFGLMAFGMLAVVGMQSTLRVNADLARQRSEAVRIAQAEIEKWRGFSTMGTTVGKAAYDDITTVAPVPVASTSYNSTYNTTYTLSRVVTTEPPLTDTAPAQVKTVIVDVTWEDRYHPGQQLLVRLSSAIAGIEPSLEGSAMLAMNLDPVLQPLSRFRGIPPGAVNLGGGNSGYIPPGQAPAASYVAWLFNNTSGLITLCSTAAASAALINVSTDCTLGSALLVTGFIRYDNSTPPSAASVAQPTNAVPDLGIGVVAPTAPAPGPSCFTDASTPGVRAYYCAVPISVASPKWTGNIVFTSAAVATASSPAASLPSLYALCRYSGVPLSYTNQATAVINQNFVAIVAGNLSGSYSCPAPTAAFQP